MFTLSRDGSYYIVSAHPSGDVDEITELEIPAKHKGKPVKQINSLSPFIALEKVIIPDSVTTIGYRSFFGCAALSEIAIPDSVTAIDKEALKDVKEEIKTKLKDRKLNNDETLYYTTLQEIREANKIKWNDDVLKKAYKNYMEKIIEAAKEQAAQ